MSAVENELTPKQRYEAKKAARLARETAHREEYFGVGNRRAAPPAEDEMILLFERFVDAAERIADALEVKK